MKTFRPAARPNPAAPPAATRYAGLSVLGPADAQRRLLALLRGAPGVVQAHAAARQDRVVWLEYSPQATDVDRVVSAARRRGVTVTPWE